MWVLLLEVLSVDGRLTSLVEKGTIVLCAIPFEIGWLLISCAHHVSMFHAGRIITGLGIGVISLAYPVGHKGLK